MSHLLEVMGRGLIAHLSGAFSDVLGGDCLESFDELMAELEQDPDNLELCVKIGAYYLREEEPIAARKLFLDVLGRDASHFGARIGLACAFDSLDQVEVSLEQLRIAQKSDPRNPAILFCLGYCHERSGNEDSAVDYYQDALSICPTLRNAHERLGAIFLKNEEADAAIHHYKHLCELDPHQVDLHLALAGLLLKTGDCAGAISRYEHALTLEPDNWSVHNDTVSAYEEAGLIREAIEHLHKMIEHDSEFADARLRLGDLYARLGDDVAAVAQYRRALDLSPDYLEANVKLGTQHLRAGRFCEAARSFSFALEINDRLLSAYVGIGVAHQAEGRDDEAAASFEMARNVEPNSNLLFSEVARMQLKADASLEANRYLSNAETAPEPDQPAAPTVDLISRQIQRLRQSIQQSPNHADLHYRLGLLLRNRGQVEDAVEAFEAAVTINPCYMKALIKLGLALKELGRDEDALAAFRRAVEIEPGYLDLHYQLGLLFAKRYQFEIAVEHFEQATKGNPENVDFQANLALSLQNLGLIDRANASWQIVCELAPDSPQAAHARVAMAEQEKP